MDTTMQFFKPDDELDNLIHFATETYKRAAKESPNVSARELFPALLGAVEQMTGELTDPLQFSADAVQYQWNQLTWSKLVSPIFTKERLTCCVRWSQHLPSRPKQNYRGKSCRTLMWRWSMRRRMKILRQLLPNL